MGRLLPLAVIVCAASVAHAEPTREVLIETSPPGALVYLELIENGPLCTATPCTVKLPIGEPSLVIELKGYSRLYHALQVPRRGKIKREVITLEKAVGTLVIAGPKGATVLVDGEAQGKAPLRLDVTADSHEVVLMKGGKQIHSDFVEVKAGEELEVAAGGTGGGGDDGGAGDDDGDGEIKPDSGGDDDDTDLRVKRGGPVAPLARAPLVRASAAFDLGFRQFTYGGVQTGGTLRSYSEAGQVLAGLLVEVWPGALTSNPVLRRLSLLLRFQHGLHPQQISGGGLVNPASTYWQALEVSARYRHQLGKVGVEGGLGYARDRAQFEGNTSDIRLLPDADYQSIRVGVRATTTVRGFEPYLSIEKRFVTSGGKLAERFGDDTSISGFKASLGVGRSFGVVTARLEATYARYSWDFAYQPMSLFIADTGVDAFQLVQLAVGYQY